AFQFLAQINDICARTDERHVTLDNGESLRKFIETRLANKMAYASNFVTTFRQPHTTITSLHATELIHIENFIVAPNTLLTNQHRSAVLQLHCNGNEWIDDESN